MENNEQVQIRLEKLKWLEENGIDPYGDKFTSTHNTITLNEEYDQFDKPTLEEMQVEVQMVGRMMTKRGQGKAGFAHLQDQQGRFQIYVRKDMLDELSFEVFKKSDIGDIIGVSGIVMKTNHGEVTIKVKEYTHLTKSLRPLPEKYHGLTDVEERYRNRFVDLIMNQDVKETFIKRTKIIKSVRNTLDERGYLEVETPVLQHTLGGASARPFNTHHNALDEEFKLRIATELPLKKLMVGGLEKVYEIGRLFRNEGIDTTHNPEFTTIEFYESFANLDDMMQLTQKVIIDAAMAANNTTEVEFGEHKFDLKNGIRVKTMNELVSEKVGTNIEDIKNDYDKLVAIADKFDVELKKHHDKPGHVIYELFDELVEKSLIEPTFVVGFPQEVTILARPDKENPGQAHRFELFMCGQEFANAYFELNNPLIQRQLFDNQQAEKELGNDEANDVDYNFLLALEYGMPPAGGVGIGIDRLVMLLTNNTSIKEVILFPTLREK